MHKRKRHHLTLREDVYTACKDCASEDNFYSVSNWIENLLIENLIQLGHPSFTSNKSRATDAAKAVALMRERKETRRQTIKQTPQDGVERDNSVGRDEDDSPRRVIGINGKLKGEPTKSELEDALLKINFDKFVDFDFYACSHVELMKIARKHLPPDHAIWDYE